MIYAPIVIPTLNRRYHLQRCIESLQKCTNINETDLFISVDYPPAEKYIKGYKEVVNFVKTFDFSGFKSFHVFYQEKNLGPYKNIEFLYQQVQPNYDRVILTEDDNEFAPNFLEYMNKGLTAFADNEQIIYICANKDADWVVDKTNVALVKLCSPYGMGMWFHKKSSFENKCISMLEDKSAWRLRNILSLYLHNPRLYSIFVNSILCNNKGLFWKSNGELNFVDTVNSIFMNLTDKLCVVPIVSKSRTFGNDGSGVNMAAREDNGTQEIDTRKSFEIENSDEVRFYKANYAVARKYMGLGYFSKPVFHAHLFVLLLLLCGNNRERFIKLLKRK